MTYINSKCCLSSVFMYLLVANINALKTDLKHNIRTELEILHSCFSKNVTCCPLVVESFSTNRSDSPHQPLKAAMLFC